MAKRRQPEFLKGLPAIPGFDPVATAGDGDWFDEKAARRACDFFAECLRHEKGEWSRKAFELRPWQKAIIANLFGWKRADGTRRFRQAYIEIPRKNGKSQLIAGIGLYMLFCDGEAGAEIYCCAGDKRQAAIVGDAARAMVRMEPELARRGEVLRNVIVVQATASKLEILSSDADLKHGLNCSTLIYDELHTAPNRELWDVMVTSMGARVQPLVISITTAGTSRQTLCWEQHEYAEKVRDGLIRDSAFLPVIFAAPEEMDFSDPRAWEIANPNLDVSIKRGYIAEQAKKAVEQPQYEIAFRTLHLNQWTTVQRRWIPHDRWAKCREDFTLEEMDGRECFVGIDLSSTTDLTSVALIFPGADGYRVWVTSFVPEEKADIRERQDRVPYRTWARQGHIVSTPGNVIDYEHVDAVVRGYAERFVVRMIGYDPYNAQQLVNSWQSDGLPVTEVRQGFLTLSDPTKRFETLVLGVKLRHPGNPVLDWAVSNVCCETDPAGNIKPSKRRSTEKIDPVAALVTGLAVALADDDGTSVYSERGLLVL